MATGDTLTLMTDGRYATSVETARTRGELPEGLAVVIVESTYEASLAEVLRGLAPRRVGVESAHFSVDQYRTLRAGIGAVDADAPGDGQPRLVPVTGLVERLRVRKDTHELATLRQAGQRLSDLVPDILATARPGRAERAVAADIDWLLVTGGFERPAFETIVASGPNSALPHARPSERILQRGDAVVLDFGGVYDGYCVDFTRTVMLGDPSPALEHVLGAVEHAQGAALAALRPGARPSDVDAAARDVLIEAGLGEAFSHSTGHGLGLEVHEDPRLGRRRPADDQHEDPLEAGMVVTVGPGAYLPGIGGVRLEDDAVVTEGGCEVITHAPARSVLGLGMTR